MKWEDGLRVILIAVAVAAGLWAFGTSVGLAILFGVIAAAADALQRHIH